MKRKRVGSLFSASLLPEILIIGIGSVLTRAKIFNETNLTPIMAPSGGGGPGGVENWAYQAYLEDNSIPVNHIWVFEYSFWDSSGSEAPPGEGTRIRFQLSSV